MKRAPLSPVALLSAVLALTLGASGCRSDPPPPVAPLRPAYTPQPTYGPPPSSPAQTGPAMGPFGFLLPPGGTLPPPAPGELPWPFDPKYWPPGWAPQPQPQPPAPQPPAPQPPVQPQPGPAPPSGGAFSAEEVRVLELVNQRRARGATCGDASFAPAGPLALHPQLVQASRGHSMDMGRRGYFSHDSPEGVGPGERARAAGYSYRGIAENIAAGNATPEETVEQWMNSSGHCGNIMTPSYHVMGIGHAVAQGSRFTHYWTQMFGF